MDIRLEAPEDFAEIWDLNNQVYDTDAEANLVNAIRSSGVDYLSLIAAESTGIVGHIMFTQVQLLDESAEEVDLKIAGVAPMAIIPHLQRTGIGTLLMDKGLELCAEQGYQAVVVLGHPSYYPRFGFKSSIEYGITSEYEVQDDVFMIKELEEGVLRGLSGTIRYHEVFAGI